MISKEERTEKSDKVKGKVEWINCPQEFDKKIDWQNPEFCSHVKFLRGYVSMWHTFQSDLYKSSIGTLLSTPITASNIFTI